MGGCASQEEVEAAIKAKDDVYRAAHEGLKQKLAECDDKTRVPHLLIEVRSLGFVEIQGKNTGGIYEKLDAWLKTNWGAVYHDKDLVEKASEEQACGCCGHYVENRLGPLEDHNRLCDRSYTLGHITESGEVVSSREVYKCRGYEGENNMGKLTMQLVQFMTNECGWTFQVCDSGNLGRVGGIREQQMKFKAPHPLNLIAPHLMVELRQVGYIEINGPDTNGIYEKLERFVSRKWGSNKTAADPNYCDLKFCTNAFQSRGSEGENNMGLRTMELVDFMVKECQWTMVCCNGGNFGRKGTKREQQLVFRNDEFVQHGIDHIMVELRTCGYVEINGLHDAQDVKPLLEQFCKEQWGCKEYTPYFWESSEKFCEIKYSTTYFQRDWLWNNLGKCTIQLAEFLGQHGWALLVCNGGSITTNPENSPNDSLIREQQIKFHRAKTPERAAAPLLMIELRTDPTEDSPPQWMGFIEACGKNTNGVYEKLDEFIKTVMLGQEVSAGSFSDKRWVTQIFRLKPSEACENGRWDGYMNGESNIGQWTMRICDFMVDHLGEWDLLVCNSDNLDKSFRHGSGNDKYYNSVTAREMQLVFRHRPGGRRVFMSSDDSKPLGRAPMQPPKYWSFPGCLSGEVAHHLSASTEEETAWMQQLLDVTFKNKATRDRKPGDQLADRFAVVQVLRSEHPELWDRYALRREWMTESCRTRGVLGEFVEPKTMQVEGLKQRCTHATVGNPANQAYLLHGTNPTSAVAILERSFAVSLAGKSVGTMFGPGIYLAESSTKADEYAADDVGGEYDGLYAMLVCRVVLGRPLVVEQPGDYSGQVVYGDYDHVIGDREKAVGTFREFILFHEGSIYPEYAIFYRREKDGKILAPAKREEAPAQEPMMGTTV